MTKHQIDNGRFGVLLKMARSVCNTEATWLQLLCSYAIAIDGTPANATPCNMRRASSDSNVGVNASAIVMIDVAISDSTMSGLRPHSFDNEPKTIKLKVSGSVAAESARLAVAGETLYVSLKCGNNV